MKTNVEMKPYTVGQYNNFIKGVDRAESTSVFTQF
jgi:hypothetical protein